MRVAGKCPPTPESLRAAHERGFDAVELHLPRGVLDDVEAAVAAVRDSPVEACSVHTPHVPPEDDDAFRRADDLAGRLDAYLVVHSQYVHHSNVADLEAHEFAARYGYENNPGASVRHLRATLLDRGRELVLDTAHLYMADADYLDAMAALLTREGDRIPVVHLADSTPTEDGVPFGDGAMDVPAACRLLKRAFDGTVVLETMPDHQADALATFRDA